MSALPSEVVKSLPQSRQLKTGECFLSGRIASRRKVASQEGSLFFTIVKLPAVDAYSHPGTVELQSSAAIGASGDEWSGVVRVTGVANSYDTKPDEHGEVKRVLSARNRLVVVD